MRQEVNMQQQKGSSLIEVMVGVMLFSLLAQSLIAVHLLLYQSSLKLKAKRQATFEAQYMLTQLMVITDFKPMTIAELTAYFQQLQPPKSDDLSVQYVATFDLTFEYQASLPVGKLYQIDLTANWPKQSSISPIHWQSLLYLKLEV